MEIKRLEDVDVGGDDRIEGQQLGDTAPSLHNNHRHCEERSDAAI